MFWHLDATSLFLWEQYEINECQLALQAHRKQTVTTDRQQLGHTALLKGFKRACYPGMRATSLCSQHMMSWGPFANNERSNPQGFAREDDALSLWVSQINSRPRCVYEDCRSERTVSRSRRSIFLQTSSLLRLGDADARRTVKSSGSPPANKLCASRRRSWNIWKQFDS